MYKILFLFAILCAANSASTRKYYYPDIHDPNAIVFDGPTNFEDRNADTKTSESVADKSSAPDNTEVEDSSKNENNGTGVQYDIDVRFKPKCPPEHTLMGNVCVSNNKD